jgi:biopolymer transport protein ExbD
MIRWNRGSRDHHLHKREDAELNLIPLIDILSVMVAFLLVYSVDVEVVQNSKGVEIPQSTADALPNQSVVVMITRDQLFVQGELVAAIADVERTEEAYIEPLLAVLARPLVGVEADAESQQAALASREITVVADKSLPYEVVKKVMATCTSAAYGRISLAVIEKDRPAGIHGVAAT